MFDECRMLALSVINALHIDAARLVFLVRSQVMDGESYRSRYGKLSYLPAVG